MEAIKILYDMIAEKLSKLSEREQIIIKSRYGLEKYANNIYSYDELSQILEISCRKVSIIEQLYQQIKTYAKMLYK